jgi:hypothetical protein
MCLKDQDTRSLKQSSKPFYETSNLFNTELVNNVLFHF